MRVSAFVLTCLLAASMTLVSLPARAATPIATTTAATCVKKIGPGIPPPAAVPMKLGGFHASWYGQSGYMTLCPGDTDSATVAYYNSGSLGWVQGKMGESAYLGTWGPEPGQDRASAIGGDGTNGSPSTSWVRFNRPAIQPASYVGPGQVAWFQFPVKAPMTPGIYFLGLRPLIEGATWLEDYGVFWVITVLNADGTQPPYRCQQCWPLSGAPLVGADASRRPISVKIDNASISRPHYGLSDADMVWETLVEGYITRLNLVFHSRESDTVGSVRSGRLFDRYLTPTLRGALAYSGATNTELYWFEQDVKAGSYVDIGAATGAGNAYYRVNFRLIPHNEFTSTGALRSALAAQGKAGAVQVPSWDFSLPKFESAFDLNGLVGSVPATTLSIPYRAGVEVRYQFDSSSKTYARWQAGVREIDGANDQPVAPTNVVILGTEVWQTDIIEDILGSKGLDERTTGTGPCIVFTQGRRQDCNWSRATVNDPFVLTNFYGKRILLSPGQTWFHLVPKDWQIPST
ncbi:MAG: hypothetical protein AUH85_01600 [Chloroflexi bacterium 13_1_40CM_4_68_4]|nr:MAG: hypothetical protein AUH85_01600 [Chloroflexi bacterium 13_1_40CM_4_68_4]